MALAGYLCVITSYLSASLLPYPIILSILYRCGCSCASTPCMLSMLNSRLVAVPLVSWVDGEFLSPQCPQPYPPRTTSPSGVNLEVSSPWGNPSTMGFW